MAALPASRRGGAIEVNVENVDSIGQTFRKGDLVIDAAGPFQRRTTALIEGALQIGFDVVDIADSLSYVASVHRLRPDIEASGSRILTACSTMSSVSALALRLSQI